MEIYLTKKFGKLVPSWDSDKEKLRKFKDGATIKAKLSNPRNLKFHKLHMALINMVFDNLPEEYTTPTPVVIEGTTHFMARIPDTEALRDEIKIIMGHVERRITMDGEILLKTKSISFAAMEQVEFEEFHDKTIDIIIQHFLKGTNKQELINEVLDFNKEIQ